VEEKSLKYKTREKYLHKLIAQKILSLSSKKLNVIDFGFKDGVKINKVS